MKKVILNSINNLVVISTVLIISSSSLLAEENSKGEKIIEKQVTEALELALMHLRPSTESFHTTLEYRTPADNLRFQADRMEQRDAAIKQIQNTLQTWKIYQAEQQLINRQPPQQKEKRK